MGSASCNENSLQLIHYNEEVSDPVSCVYEYGHPGEICAIAPSPTDACQLMTASTTGDVVLWRAPGADEAPDLDASSLPTSDLESLAAVRESGGCTGVMWSGAQVATLGHFAVRIWDVEGAGSFLERTTIDVPGVPSDVGSGILSGAWDPHHSALLSTTVGGSAQGWDTRSGRSSYTIPGAHKYAARSIDYNPNKPQFVTTGGDDRLVKFWDLRAPKSPVLSLAGHSHWVMSVKYNRFHDQLLLSGGGDSLVALWRCSSVSSAPLLEELDGEDAVSKADTGDCKVRTFETEDSVYSVSWSSGDAWVFAAVDYSGKVTINHVPATEKYKILL